MTDEDLIGYLLDATEPAERAAVESRLHTDPEAAARLELLRRALAPLDAARSPVEPPAGLADRTLARLAAELGEVPPADRPHAEPAVPSALPRAPREAPELTAVGGRFRLDVFVAAGIALFACGILFSAVGKLRAQNQTVACQNTLRTVSAGLGGYADTHNGRYPQVGVGSAATAEAFAAVLADSGQVPADFRPCCPAAAAASPTFVGYTYTLGYRTPGGGLLGLRQPDGTGEGDLVPIVADFPAAAAAPAPGPTCPHATGMNVLFAGGHVRLTTSPLVGPGGDDIFRNVFGRVEAGADRTDVVLGRPGDRP